MSKPAEGAIIGNELPQPLSKRVNLKIAISSENDKLLESLTVMLYVGGNTDDTVADTICAKDVAGVLSDCYESDYET